MIDRPAAEALERECRSRAEAITTRAVGFENDAEVWMLAADFIRDALSVSERVRTAEDRTADAVKRMLLATADKYLVETERDALRAKLDALAVPSEHAGLVEELRSAARHCGKQDYEYATGLFVEDVLLRAAAALEAREVK